MMMQGQRYAIFSACFLVFTAILAVIHYLYIEPGSRAEALVYLLAAFSFSLLAFLNLSLYRHDESDGMTKVHAASRSVMFVIASAFAVYLALN